MPKRALCSFGVDVDACSGWLDSYGKGDSPNDMTRGCFAGEVGVPRLLKLFKKYNLKTSWFVPGHSLDTFPEQITMVRDAGHEIGLHGYSHENPKKMTIEQQRDVLDHTIKQLTEFCGKPPKGHTTCWWETSKESIQLLIDRGIEYDHSSQAHDCQPFYTRDEDTWTKINYDGDAKDWMKPLVRGKTTELVTIPANWYLDDLPPHMFIKDAPNSHGFVDARSTLQLWKDHFTYFYREEESFVFPLTIHPDTSGRPHLLLVLEELIEWINGHEGVEWVTMGEMNDDFRARNPLVANEK